MTDKITIDRAVLEQALSTLEGWGNYDKWVWHESALSTAKKNTAEMIPALRAALERPQGERLGGFYVGKSILHEGGKMTDREFLELAAKAAGIEVFFDDDGDCYRVKASGHRNYWNPLQFDGDALRLAVKLRISIEINERSVIARWVDGGYETKDVYEYPDSIQGDDFNIVYVNHEKAARRAIFRAAAEIGRNMP